MANVKKTNSIAKLISGILVAAALLTTTCLTTAYASDDNQGVMDVFPAFGVSPDTMDVNAGTINTLSYSGTVKDNKGTISSSLGTVYENHGTIEQLSAGHAGTNYGVINRIENTGSLGENNPEGTVLFVGMGNVITRNDGTIQANAGNIADNYGTVGENYGTVLMHDGQIVTNEQGGTVTFEAKISGGETIPAKGRIEFNKGNVRIDSGNVTIKENTGNIEITNASVTVEKNSGSIALGANAMLTCDENTSDGEITKTDKSAGIACGSNDGLILDENVARYRIVFAGDDGNAEILACDLEIDGVSYTLAGGSVVFSLPLEYECSDAMKYKSNTWVLDAFPAEGDTEFTIVCHKCTPGDYRMTADKHWQECAKCGKTLTDTEGIHTFGAYVSDDNSTCVKDGTETCRCTVCGYGHARTVADSHLTSDHHEHVVTDQRVEPTETSTGLTEGSRCEDCHKVLKAQEIIPVLEHAHNYSYSTVMTDPTCTEKGYTTHTCACGESYVDTYVDAKGHTEVTDEAVAATCTAAGLTEGKHCSVCGAVLVAQSFTKRMEHTFSGNICAVCGYTKPSSGSSTPATYAITVADSTHGSISTSAKTASAGDTVTIDVTPDKGCILEAITVTDKNSKEVDLTAIEIGKTYTFKMPANAVTVKVTFMEDNTLMNYFVDVPADAYYYNAVLWAAENGITSGVDAVHFDPNGTCTRAQAVTFLWRAAGCPEVEIGDTFTDVVKGSYYEKAVAWAVAEGITSGTSEAAFSPDAECTRAQIVTFLWRTAGSPAILNMTASGPANPFGDVAAVDYYYDAALWAAGQGITEGTTATTFSPDATCTRAQIVALLYRYMG